MLKLAEEPLYFRGGSKCSCVLCGFAGNGAASASLKGPGTKGNGKVVP